MDTTTETTPLRAVALVCTLSPSPKPSSSQLLAEHLEKTPEKTAATTRTLAANTAHLGRRLKSSAYPPSS